MNWFLLAVAIAFVVTWIILHFVFAVGLGVLNMLWMVGIVFLFLAGVQSLEG
jgi:hypothetical protein